MLSQKWGEDVAYLNNQRSLSDLAWCLLSAFVSQLCAKSFSTGTQTTFFLGSCDFGEGGCSVWIQDPKEVLWELVKFHICEREYIEYVELYIWLLMGCVSNSFKTAWPKEFISTNADDFKALKDYMVLSFRVFLITETF